MYRASDFLAEATCNLDARRHREVALADVAKARYVVLLARWQCIDALQQQVPL